jgi:membrane protein required for beta-lactamase induction
MLIFKALHILAMFTMIAVFLGGETFWTLAVWRRDVRLLASLHDLEAQSRIPQFGLVALGLGIVFGLLTAATGGFQFLAGWLIAAYILVAAFFINVAVTGVQLIRLSEEAVDAEAGKRSVEEVVRHMAKRRGPRLFFPINVAIFTLIIVDMVLKPF